MIDDRNDIDRQFRDHLSILIDNRWDHYTTKWKTMIYIYIIDDTFYRFSMIDMGSIYTMIDNDKW